MTMLELKRQDAKPYGGAKTRQESAAALDQLAHDVIGAAIEVHRHLGPGFLESVYEEAMCVALASRQLPFVREATIAIRYKEQPVGDGRIDLWVGESLVVELKAVEALAPIHSAQLLSYLRSNDCHLGLLINFNNELLRNGIKRIINLA
jgi:GxxExxY protein